MTTDVRPEVDQEAVGEAMEKVMGDFAAAIGVTTVLLGISSGAWKAMAAAGPVTPSELADRMGTVEPYTREWLAAQAAAGYVEYDANTGTFTLPGAVAAVLTDDATTALFSAFGEGMAVMGADLARFRDRFATGQGFGWHERSPEHWEAMAGISDASVIPFLPAWLAAMDGGDALLAAGGKVADVGCGYGGMATALARLYPGATVYGFDYHDASIARSRSTATDAGVGDRVHAEVATAKDYPGTAYDLITFVDSLHDLGDPVGALVHAREALSPEGSVLLIEPAAGDSLEDNLTPVGRLWYSVSTTVCTPNGVAQEGHPLGTVAGEVKLRETAAAAGFARVTRLDVEAPMNLLLQLRP
ncbi:class I SAM-dependent methyltransferase [Nocardioides sp. CPCC 206347]|uniref:class I SAM-dependent methyltransferase n=1 Tax=Nocardioides sp. CPCC 206347 TaxID=3406463 RepID=UPI003B42ED6E